MSGEAGYGVPVDADEASAALESTRILRLALNALWNGLDGLPPDAVTGPVPEALTSIHDRINEIEAPRCAPGDAREHYLIIRPISPVSPPPPQIMEKITAAVRTLAELGMLVGQHVARYRV